MEDIIKCEKEDYPKIIREAIGEIDDVSYVLTLEYDRSLCYKWRVKLYKEVRFTGAGTWSSRQVSFSWKFFANRYFNKLIARHNFNEE